MPNVMYISGGGAPTLHKTQHQDGGTDEISVAGLTGLLVDEQYSAWGAVSGKPSTFAPSAHKASHQSGGSDVLDVTGLVGRVNYVDRGDPAAPDFTTGSFNKNGVWHAWDLHTIVPPGAKHVFLFVSAQATIAGGGFYIKKNGNANDNNVDGLTTQVANGPITQSLRCDCDTSQNIMYYATNTTWTVLDITVRGWLI